MSPPDQQSAASPHRARLGLAALLICALAALPADAAASFPGAPGEIAFARRTAERVVFDTFLVRPGGGALRNLTRSAGAHELAAAWSPEGERLALDRSPLDGRRGIYLMNADRSGLRRLVAGGQDPAWSPDGTRIAYRAGRRGDIWAIPVSGGRPRNLTRSPASSERSPAWSPDGRRIAFVSNAGESTDAEVWVMRADGKSRRALTNNRGIVDDHPDWSPDGERIAFMRAPTFVGGALLTIRPDGTDERLVRGGESAGDPVWSPDGSEIAFTRGRPNFGEPEEIAAIRPDGTGERTIVSGPGFNSDPAWRALPPLRLSFRDVRLTRSGAARVRVGCGPQVAGACEVRVRLVTERAVACRARSRTRRVRLGERTLTIPAGRVGIAEVRLARSSRALIACLRRARVRATAAGRDGEGAVAGAASRFVLAAR